MIDFEGEVLAEETIRDLRRMIEFLEPKEQNRFLRRAGGIVKRSIKKNFARGGRPKWKPLAESTIERRRRTKESASLPSGYGEKTFGGAKGKMAKSTSVYMHTTGRGGFQDPYALIGVLGTQRGRLWKPMEYLHEGTPQIVGRHFVVLQEEDERAIVKAGWDFVDRAIRAGTSRR